MSKLFAMKRTRKRASKQVASTSSSLSKSAKASSSSYSPLLLTMHQSLPASAGFLQEVGSGGGGDVGVKATKLSKSGGKPVTKKKEKSKESASASKHYSKSNKPLATIDSSASTNFEPLSKKFAVASDFGAAETSTATNTSSVMISAVSNSGGVKKEDVELHINELSLLDLHSSEDDTDRQQLIRFKNLTLKYNKTARIKSSHLAC